VSTTDGRTRIVRRWMFNSEPRIGGIRADGPAAGKLREGDILTAIDGVLITTREGSRRFATVEPGTPVMLTVRRDGRELPVRIVAGAVCPERALRPEPVVAPVAPRRPRFVMLSPTPPTPPTPATERRPPTPPTPAVAPVARPDADPQQPLLAGRAQDTLPRGWNGFGLTCRDCGSLPDEPGERPAWEFGTQPEIYFVDPESPAARAGFQIGDVLTHIDGVSLLTPDGGRRFGAIAPGQKVRWTYRRGGRVLNATLVTVPRPGERTTPLLELPEQLRALSQHRDVERMSSEMRRLAREMERVGLRASERQTAGKRLRYAGTVGGSEVEVRGLDNVVVDDSGDEIVITTRDATIRIRTGVVPAATRPPRAPEPH
jgi:hypothetical protein